MSVVCEQTVVRAHPAVLLRIQAWTLTYVGLIQEEHSFSSTIMSLCLKKIMCFPSSSRCWIVSYLLNGLLYVFLSATLFLIMPRAPIFSQTNLCSQTNFMRHSYRTEHKQDYILYAKGAGGKGVWVKGNKEELSWAELNESWWTESTGRAWCRKSLVIWPIDFLAPVSCWALSFHQFSFDLNSVLFWQCFTRTTISCLYQGPWPWRGAL